MAKMEGAGVEVDQMQIHCDLFQQNQLSRRNSSNTITGSKSSTSQIVEFYANRSVFITGGSGFVGKVLIEKLLRSCPKIKHIFVLIRPKWQKKPSDRLEELLQAPLFDGVRCQQLMDKVIVVEGDVTQTNLGMSNENLLRIMNEVSVIYHSAATVKFDEPLKQSIGINIAGTKHIIELGRKIPQLAALVHVSTAYANCDLKEIDEYIYPVGMDPENLVEMAKWLDQDTLQELKFRLLKSKPNTYTYTKALAEWLLIKCARDLPVVVCRPSIVVASWREPFAGWIDNVNGPTGVILGAGKGLVRSMYADPNCVADLVPVDTVINMVIALGWFAHIYQNHKQPNDSSAESLSESLIGSSSSERSFEDLTSGLSNQSNNNYNYNEDQNNTNNNMTTFAHNLNSLIPTGETFDSIRTITTTNTNNNLGAMYHQDDGYLSNTPSPNATRSSNSPLVSMSVDNKNLNLNNGADINTNINFNMNNNNNNNSSSRSNRNKTIMDQNQMMLSLVSERKMADEKHAAFEYKLKQFRHNIQVKLSSHDLPEDIADVPVFHCTSGSSNPITWGTLQLIILSVLALFPSKSTYRYPNGSFTKNKFLDDFYRITLHYTPGYIVDFVTRLLGGKPMLVRVFKKFDQAANVLSSFTLYQWNFNTDNTSMLIKELMSDEDKRLFNFDLTEMSWKDFLGNYALGVRTYLLKEPVETLEESRQKLKLVYIRNLSLQVLFYAVTMYYLSTYLIAPLVY